MDRAWMRRKLEQALEVRQQLDFHQELAAGKQLDEDGVAYFDSIPPQELVYFLMVRLEPTVQEIFRAIDPEGRFLSSDSDWNHTYTPVDRHNLERAVALVEDQQEWAVRLAPDSPSLVADQFHHWVWSAAQPLFQSGHHRAAVHAAANSVTVNTQAKVNRTDVFDDDLMNQVFSSDAPKPGKPRLRLAGDPPDKTVASRQRALMPFAAGCYAGLRNLAAHESGPDWPEHRALQALACFSVLASWIEECRVVEYDGDGGATAVTSAAAKVPAQPQRTRPPGQGVTDSSPASPTV
ncbi:hypothetical protein KGA66_26900 [Actinocrinis puniceicyclus]|uniref:Conserved hypothetical protein CHP02391 domain-containing protein n=1 Tax=Actinocrinis puniceicyclus TaxID=977794 RepID=A0A8J7WTY9_9ACTN|nr:TIGR02391 family protein [Actinocrinis puniceicyclus]MBS2966695.1 hypothetical protein [Actinocrinis puniceicyclus]